MKKIYTIKIQKVTKKGIWYSSRNGEEFEAYLGLNCVDSIVFKVSDLLIVYPIDCIVISEKIIEPYKN